jgi:hypothetical protein
MYHAPRRIAIVEAQACEVLLRTVAPFAALLEDGLHVAYEVDPASACAQRRECQNAK